MSPAAFVERAGALGVAASVTSDGIQLPGGFLAGIDGPFEPQLLDSSTATARFELGPATLAITGGTNEVEREAHQQPEAVRAVSHDIAAQLAAITGQPDRIESAASRKVSALTRLVHALTPLATAVILPKANHLALGAREFAERAAEYLDHDGYHFPLWTALKVYDEPGCRLLTSVGMWIFALPELVIPLPDDMDPSERMELMGALMREMVAEGIWFSEGQDVGPFRFRAGHDAVFAAAPDVHELPFIRRAYDKFVRLRALMSLLGPHTLHRVPLPVREIVTEHFIRPSGASAAVTNGISDFVQPGSCAEDENQRVELTLSCPHLGAWASGWLAWAAEGFLEHDASRPIRPFDLLTLDEPAHGIAGVVVCPHGQIDDQRPGDSLVHLWKLLPITSEELESFRAKPGSLADWVHQRNDRGDVAAIERRWPSAP